MNSISTWIASGFGSGYLKPAPGTWGSLVACVVLFLLSLTPWAHFPLVLLMLVIFTVGGYLAIEALPDTWRDDDQRIVVDEIVGVFVSVLWLPLTATNIILAFVLFRLYDIFKPLGIRKFDNIKTSWAVLVDDMVAGVYSNITIRLLTILLPWT